MVQWRLFLAMLLVTALAGGLAGWAGVEYGLHRVRAQDDLDAVLHRDLHLTDDQKARIAKLESNFAVERSAYRTEMRAANKQLALALTQGNPDQSEIEHAIHRFHTAMAAFQMRTVKHVLAMRSILTPQQAKIFDSTVYKTLGADRP
jgi:Spy/CpxP family protein refolding chaperone